MRRNYMDKTGKINTSIGIFLLSLLLSLIGYGYTKKEPEVQIVEAKEIEQPQVTSTPTPTPIPTDIKGYVEYKFGNKAELALKVLECENKTLNPYAINDNTAWGGTGRDRGYWQINDVFHPYVSDECARDVKCSTDYAYRMFKNDNETFVRWTCGR